MCYGDRQQCQPLSATDNFVQCVALRSRLPYSILPSSLSPSSLPSSTLLTLPRIPLTPHSPPFFHTSHLHSPPSPFSSLLFSHSPPICSSYFQLSSILPHFSSSLPSLCPSSSLLSSHSPPTSSSHSQLLSLLSLSSPLLSPSSSITAKCLGLSA